MSKQIEKLNWDSNFFQYKIGKIKVNNFGDISQIVDHAVKNEYRLVYLFTRKKIPSIILNEIENLKFVDSKVSFLKRFSKEDSILYHNNSIRYTKNEPNSDLLNLALQSGIYSRYYTDKNFKNNEFEYLYTEWINNSINGKIADSVITYQNEGKYVGLLTLSKKDNFSSIGLLAVDDSCRKMGIGRQLIQYAMYQTYVEWNLNAIQVYTQEENLNACKFYELMGFIKSNVEYIYHLWL